jgi:UDP-glucose:glycoprotein glucosyltransferase
MHTLTSLSLSRKHAIELLTHSALAASFSSQGGNNKAGGVVDAMYDASDRVEGGGVVVWWNDIEKDKRCVPSSVFFVVVVCVYVKREAKG